MWPFKRHEIDESKHVESSLMNHAASMVPPEPESMKLVYGLELPTVAPTSGDWMDLEYNGVAYYRQGQKVGLLPWKMITAINEGRIILGGVVYCDIKCPLVNTQDFLPSVTNRTLMMATLAELAAAGPLPREIISDLIILKEDTYSLMESIKENMPQIRVRTMFDFDKYLA